MSSKFGKDALHGDHGVEVAQIEPLAREVADERIGARVGDHAPNLALELGGLAERAALGCSAAARRRGCCSRRRTTAATRARRRRCGTASPAPRPAGSALDAEQELGAHEQGFERDLNAAVEAALLAVRGAIERRRTAPRRRRRPAADTRAARGSRGWSWRSSRPPACRVGSLRGRPADEDALAARRLPRARRVVRPADLDAAQIRAVTPFGDVEAARKRPEERLALPVGIDAALSRNVIATSRRPAATGTRTAQSSSARLRACCSSRATRRFIRPPKSSASSRPQRQRVGGVERERRDALAVDADLEHLRLGVDRHAFVQVARERGRERYSASCGNV